MFTPGRGGGKPGILDTRRSGVVQGYPGLFKQFEVKPRLQERPRLKKKKTFTFSTWISSGSTIRTNSDQTYEANGGDRGRSIFQCNLTHNININTGLRNQRSKMLKGRCFHTVSV